MARSRSSSSVADVPDVMTEYDSDATVVSTGTADYAIDDPMQKARDKASTAAEGVMDSARATATDQANTQKQRAADGVSKLAQAIVRISGDLQGDQPMLASIAETAAEQTQRIGQFLREKDVTEIVRSTEGFARRQPMIFYGGAFVLGLALARFLKAGTDGSDTPRGQGSTKVVDSRTGLTVGA